MSLDELGEQLDVPQDVDSEGVPSYSSIDDEEGREDSLLPFKAFFDEVKEFDCPAEAWYDDEGYYKKILTGVGESANRVHEILVSYLKATDPADRNVYRARLISAYWRLYTDVSMEVVRDDVPNPKTLMVRFGMLLPNLVSAEHRHMLATIIFEKRIDEAVWYSDEWMSLVGSGQVSPLASDEPVGKKAEGGNTAEIAKEQSNLEKIIGQFQAFVVILSDLEAERKRLMDSLNNSLSVISQTLPSTLHPGLLEPFSDPQKNEFSSVMDTCRSLSTVARNLANNYEKLKEVKEKRDATELRLKQLASGSGDAASHDKILVVKESEKIAQMVHMSVGRKGNHFPILASQFFTPNIKSVGTRENVVQIMREIEEIDSQIFRREFRRHINRIPPHVILLPCYGSYGVCWEPYERTNRATSRGRVAVPMFPRDLKIAVIWALADLRWSQAKDKAAHYWMEEGLTGQFYQWFSETKQRGDVRMSFIENYVLWITQESNGIQKLEREVRGIFWRNIPFSDERKENLKMRGFVYDDLYKKDLNRAKKL